MKFLDTDEEMVGGDYLTGSSAKWSLSSMAKQDSTVLQIVKQQYESNEDEFIKKELKEIIDGAEK